MAGTILNQNAHYAHEYPHETLDVDYATIQTQRKSVAVEQAQFSSEEVKTLLADLDALAREKSNPEVAAMVANGFPAILTATRWAKVKGTGEYRGQRAGGRELVATWLRGVHIGDAAITNNANTAGLGMYAGTIAAVYSWLPTTEWVAGTSKNIFPSQVMTEYSAIVWLGYEETEAIPKVDGYRFSIAGQNTPVLPLKFDLQRRQAERDPTVASLLEPVIFGPLQTVKADLYPNITGQSRPEPLAILISTAEKLTA